MQKSLQPMQVREAPMDNKSDRRLGWLTSWVVPLSTSACILSASPVEVTDPVIIGEFSKAQKQVAIQYPDAGDPFTVEVNDFRWKPVAEMFKCSKKNDFLTCGCFSPPETIKYCKESTGALWHESGHAILYQLGDHRWRCSFSGHENYPEC